jgi:hypothetical protein
MVGASAFSESPSWKTRARQSRRCATDGIFLRIAGMPVYGVSGVPLDADDMRADGQDERILVESFCQGLEFTGRLVRAPAAHRQ